MIRSTPRHLVPAARDAAHILFTSGSTGHPKGVVVTHANVLGFVKWAVAHFGIRAADRCSGHSPFHFDLSTFDIYGSFAAGATLCLVPPAMNIMPGELVAFMRRERLTQWFSVPSVLSYLAKFDAVRWSDFPELKRLLWCGEVFQPEAMHYWLNRLPHVRFTNLYGPTETTIASSWYEVARRRPDHPLRPAPIGRACEGEELFVLDLSLNPTAPREIGEIYIAGIGVTNGYWQDEERTWRAFLPKPGPPGTGGLMYRTGDLGYVDEDGLVHFVGRADAQVKVRGHRIELGEVEVALDLLPGLSEFAVVVIESVSFGSMEICCTASIIEGHCEIDANWIRARLLELLPRYMLPTRFKFLKRLPRNANGKIDRAAITEMFRSDARDRT